MKNFNVSCLDHAFANGQVFLKPVGFFNALRLTGNLYAARQLNRVWSQFENGATIDPKVRLSLTARLINKATQKDAHIGEESVVRGMVRVEPKGRIEVGPFCYVGDGVILSAANLIHIGEATLIAHGVQVFDNDTHPANPIDREAHFKKMLGHPANRDLPINDAPIIIGSHCWIGMHSIVMKGVTIGDNSIIAPGSVVTKNVPANVLAAGNPATVVKHLSSESY